MCLSCAKLVKDLPYDHILTEGGHMFPRCPYDQLVTYWSHNMVLICDQQKQKQLKSGIHRLAGASTVYIICILYIQPNPNGTRSHDVLIQKSNLRSCQVV